MADQDESLIAELRETLPRLWCAEYEVRVDEANILRIDLGAFTYLFDFASGLESAAQEDRVVAAFGLSSRPMVVRQASRMKGYLGATTVVFGEGYDKGHFIAHAMGGDVSDSLNWFPQATHVNRGRSTAGKLYRSIETYCSARPGTFFFTRPVYEDLTTRPAALEIGVLRDGKLETQLITNRPLETG